MQTINDGIHKYATFSLFFHCLHLFVSFQFSNSEFELQNPGYFVLLVLTPDFDDAVCFVSLVMHGLMDRYDNDLNVSLSWFINYP